MQPNLEQMGRILGELIVKYGFATAAGIVILILGWIGGNWTARWTRSRLVRNRTLDLSYVRLIENAIRYAIMALAVVVVLDQFGIETAAIIAVLASFAIAIGLALQGTLSNLAAGLMILILRLIRTGEYIEAENNAGVVQTIGLFFSTINTKEGVCVTIPNTLLWTRVVRNFSRIGQKRGELEITLAGHEKMDQACTLLKQILVRDKRIHPDPVPVVEVKDISDGGTRFATYFWTSAEDYWPTLVAMRTELKAVLEQNGIELSSEESPKTAKPARSKSSGASSTSGDKPLSAPTAPRTRTARGQTKPKKRESAGD